MPWIVVFTFLATLGVCGAVVYAVVQGGSMGIAERLANIWHFGPKTAEPSFPEKQRMKAGKALAKVGQLMPPSAQSVSRTQRLLIRAGYRNPQSVMVLRGVRLLLPILLLAVVYFTGFYQQNPVVILALTGIIGYMAPEFYVTQVVRKRQHRLQLSLPDALDLLVISMEAGLGLDQAILRVSHELRYAHPELSEELQMVNMETQLGKNRLDALRELSNRTGVEDIKGLVGMLIQTDRFGTSLAQSLRVFSDDLRLKRRQRAEEQAAKTTVKMVPPLVFFIFPALMVVILGPGIIAIMHQLMPALTGGG
ncbi:MAG TPA: type II secretion system F family protein [Candidatus Dormibacteraeota bacterium]|nr:type II secretion system F family protein [Candidatus Dormibacteraeota bacterium]